MTRKKVLNWIIIFTMLIFLLSTWLVSVMYFVDSWSTTWAEWLSGENLTGSLNGSWTMLSGSNITGSNITGK